MAAGLFLASFLWTTASSAGSEISLGPEQLQKVQEILTYFYTVREYQPPVVVEPEKAAAGPKDTPEAAALAHFSAILSGDYDRWMSLWDEPSRQLMQQRDRERDRDADFWRGRWEEGFRGFAAFHLTRRVDVGETVIIEFRATGETVSEPLVLDVVLTHVGGEWRATQSLRENPVLLYWREPGTQTERVAVGPPDR